MISEKITLVCPHYLTCWLLVSHRQGVTLAYLPPKFRKKLFKIASSRELFYGQFDLVWPHYMIHWLSGESQARSYLKLPITKMSKIFQSKLQALEKCQELCYDWDGDGGSEGTNRAESTFSGYNNILTRIHRRSLLTSFYCCRNSYWGKPFLIPV